MNGLKDAFKKLRNNGILKADDKTSLTRFIDEYTTVSINANSVGKMLPKLHKKLTNTTIPRLVANMTPLVDLATRDSQLHIP
jgi:hypothetical protein